MDSVPRNLVGSPKNVYLGVIKSSTDLENAYRAFSNFGLSKDKITVYGGAHAEKFSDFKVKNFNPEDFKTGLRAFFAADEVERESVYHEALEQGNYVVQIEAENSESELREKLSASFQAHNVHNVTYFGEQTFEEVAAASVL